MPFIQYIGRKPQKHDNVNPSGHVWQGPGDVVEVEDHLAPKLLAHDKVWREVDSMDAMIDDLFPADADADADNEKTGDDGNGSAASAEGDSDSGSGDADADADNGNEGNAPGDGADSPAAGDDDGSNGGNDDGNDNDALAATVMLMANEGKSPGEIGKALGIHHSTVGAIIRKAKAQAEKE